MVCNDWSSESAEPSDTTVGAAEAEGPAPTSINWSEPMISASAATDLRTPNTNRTESFPPYSSAMALQMRRIDRVSGWAVCSSSLTPSRRMFLSRVGILSSVKFLQYPRSTRSTRRRFPDSLTARSIADCRTSSSASPREVEAPIASLSPVFEISISYRRPSARTQSTCFRRLKRLPLRPKTGPV